MWQTDLASLSMLKCNCQVNTKLSCTYFFFIFIPLNVKEPDYWKHTANWFRCSLPLQGSLAPSETFFHRCPQALEAPPFRLGKYTKWSAAMLGFANALANSHSRQVIPLLLTKRWGEAPPELCRAISHGALERCQHEQHRLIIPLETQTSLWWELVRHTGTIIFLKDATEFLLLILSVLPFDEYFMVLRQSDPCFLTYISKDKYISLSTHERHYWTKNALTHIFLC